MNRLKWIDMAKGYGIILVVLGHLYIFNLSSWIYSFHMPLFFFISGYLFKANINFRDFITKKIASLLKPYLFMALLIIMYRTIKNIAMGEDNNILKDIFAFVLQRRETSLWFLTCLFIVSLFAFFIKKTNKTVQILIIISITILGLMYEFYISVPIIWNIDIACTSLIFFMIGNYCRENRVMEILQKQKISNKILYIFAAFMLSILGALANNRISGNGLEMIYGNYGFWPLTYIVAIFGMLFVVLISMIINNKVISYIGVNSLIYFGLHQAIVLDLLNAILKKYNLFQGINSYMDIICYAIISLLAVFGFLTAINIIIMKSKAKWFFNR